MERRLAKLLYRENFIILWVQILVVLDWDKGEALPRMTFLEPHD